MGDWTRGWTRVGQVGPSQTFDRIQQVERELEERRIIETWDNDDNWPSINKPLFAGPDAKKFDTRLKKLDDLGYGAFGRVEEVTYGSVRLARKRIPRRRGFTIEDLRQESLTMKKLDHRHVVKLVATYAPRTHELCLLIWPAAVCNLTNLLEDLESLRTNEGDREDIMDRLNALDLKDLSSFESSADQGLETYTKCPLEYLRNVMGCVSRAMAHCHANDVRHLDIKPSNILLMADRVYLADFGISRDVSGQDQTTTEGLPGTERWRAPELYADYGSSMQLSDIYSLGLVFMNIATVLYNVRLADFDNTLRYSNRQTREEELRSREDKVKKHLEKLTSHALVTPPFMFTYEGQETVRPRPIVALISRMTSSNPRNRLAAAKIDEKLSMLGGIHQIYHGECCKRPISWVENKWDNKFATIVGLRKENDRLKKRVEELEGKDETYELRIKNERKDHEHRIAILQAKLKDAENKNKILENEGLGQRPPVKRTPTRSNMPRPSRTNTVSSLNNSIGFSPNSRSTPATPAARPTIAPGPKSIQRLTSESRVPRTAQQLTTPRAYNDGPSREFREYSPSRSPSLTNMAGYTLRSRGSGSKLPLPITPGRETPNFNRDQSLTDSSMASSIFSRQSIETTATPVQGSPALDRTAIPIGENKAPQWGQLPARPPPPLEFRACTPEPLAFPSLPSSPALSVAALSVMSSPRTLRSELASENGDPARRVVPSLTSMKSWAEVANTGKRVSQSPQTLRPRAPSIRSLGVGRGSIAGSVTSN